MPSNSPEPGMDGLKRRREVYDTEPFKIIEYALQKQGVSKPLTDEFYTSVIEMADYIAAEKAALLEKVLEAVGKDIPDNEIAHMDEHFGDMARALNIYRAELREAIGGMR